jgi:hypothetical protein
MHKHPLWADPRTGAYVFENLIPFYPLFPALSKLIFAILL